MAELIQAAALMEDDRPAPLPVRRYDPDTGEVLDVPGYRPALTEEQRVDLARYMIHVRPDGMAPEQEPQYRLEAAAVRYRLDRPALWLTRTLLRGKRAQQLVRTIGPDVGGEDPVTFLRRELSDVGEFRRRVRHPARRPGFWGDLLLDDPDGAYPVSMSALVGAPDAMVRIDPEAAAASVADGSGIVVARDGSRHRVAALPPRRLWEPSRFDGALGGRVRDLPGYLHLGRA